MVKDFSDVPTTVRETLSEATLDLYLEVYRKAYETVALDEGREGSDASQAHKEAMRAVEQESVYDKERGKWYHKDEMERAEGGRGIVAERGATSPEVQEVRDIPTPREGELFTRDLEPQHGLPMLHWRGQSVDLGWFENAVAAALAQLGQDRVVERIWNHDHTVWKPEPCEITDRLGWLHSAGDMLRNLPRIESFTRDVLDAGYTHALLLGMGGSSLAPELFGVTFGTPEANLDIKVLDSTDPGAVLACAEGLDPEHSLFIVSSKSGTTVETLSLFRFFYNWTASALGTEETGAHFVAITDPGSPLAELASEYGFRELFLNDPNIGGRYSALSYFGLVPAALVGVNLSLILGSARHMSRACGPSVEVGDNAAAQLGAVLSELAKAGHDKVTLVTSPQIASFGDWAEQLIAESMGKEGTGILPVVREPVGPPGRYGRDRLFVHLQMEEDTAVDRALESLKEAGHPIVRLHLRDRYNLGGLFFLWEMAVAIACHRLKVHPFNQPNVENAKARAREMVTAYEETKRLPSETPKLSIPGITVYGDLQASSLEEALNAFLQEDIAGAPSPYSKQSYIALQAFLPPMPAITAALQGLRLSLRDRTGLATTFGYGPRFLHATGQLHKGDTGHGLFIQLTADHPQDAAIPAETGQPASSLTFGALIHAQALGDQKALEDAGRQVIRLHLGEQVAANIERLTHLVEEEAV